MKGRGGYALVAAVGMLAAFSAIALGAGLHVRLLHRAAANHVLEQRLVLAVHAAIARRQSGLRGAWPGTADLDAAIPDTIGIGAAVTITTARDGHARLDVNAASEDELRRFLGALRVDAGVADRLAQAIADWRDPDDYRRARGAEDREYSQLGLAAPENRPFGSLTELRSVAGMTDKLFELVSPYLSLRGGGRVNVNAAELPVLLALPGISPLVASVVLHRRETGLPVRSIPELVDLLPSAAREAMLPHLPVLTTRAAFDTEAIELVSEAFENQALQRVVAHVRIERAGNGTIVTWMQVL